MNKERTVLLSKDFLDEISNAIDLQNTIIFPIARLDKEKEIVIVAKHFGNRYVMFAKVYVDGKLRVDMQLDENFDFEYFKELPRVVEVNVDAERDDDSWYWDIRFDQEDRVTGPLDWDTIEESIKSESLQKKSEWSCDTLDEDDGYVRVLFLGTVFGLTPSGKFYMPFACSNLEHCPECDGESVIEVRGEDGEPEKIDCVRCGGMGSEEAYMDRLWFEEMEEEANNRGISFECGEGDPCDRFAVTYYDEEDLTPEELEPFKE